MYIMANLARTLYTAVTSNLERRVYEHRQGVVPGFTSKYASETAGVLRGNPGPPRRNCAGEADQGRGPAQKLDLIGSLNPEWQDLAAPWLGVADSSPSAQNDSQFPGRVRQRSRSGGGFFAFGSE